MGKCLSNRKFGLPGVFVLCYAAIVVAYGFFSYRASTKDELENIDDSLKLVASQIKNILPKDFHDRAISSKAISKEEDAANVKALSLYVMKTTAGYGVERVYTMLVDDGALYLTSSSHASGGDALEKTETPYFLPLGSPPKAALRALKSGCPTYSNGGSTGRTVFLPGQSSNKKRHYLVCADMSAAEIERRLDHPMWRSFATSGAFLLLLVPLILIFRKSDKERVEQFETLREVLHDKTLNRTSVIERKIKEFIEKH